MFLTKFFPMKHVMKLNKHVHLPFEHQMIKTFQCNFRWLNQSTCGKTKETILLCAFHGLLEDIEKALGTCFSNFGWLNISAWFATIPSMR